MRVRVPTADEPKVRDTFASLPTVRLAPLRGRSPMSSLARWCFRRRFVVVGLWFVALLVIGGINSAQGSKYTDQFTLPGTESTRALNLLEKSFPSQSGDTAQVVWKASDVKDPAVKEKVTGMLGKLSKLPHVVEVKSPYDEANAGQVSK